MKDLGVTAVATIASYPLRLMEIAKKENFDFSETRLKKGYAERKYVPKEWENVLKK